ncbi:SGNH/GDSL hydrolase family protein [Clostridium sp. KNHs205]|uniref:SGNH/GDSL hydrolase family protein n=1 Tax=Clostridium sp. KNHs205 TaxID=1449050 RepID=UPI00051CA8A3|nr:SGNH/GDSL hydrolase family protein [Clostridium sp. KNHs205]
MELKVIADRGIVDFGNLYRIGKVMRKAQAGENITIGMIGGSITQGSLSSTPKTCYAYLVYEWWVNKFRNSNIQYVNGGIGGTTSQFGVARVEEDLLCHKPDFVITEFSVNDTNNLFFQETYEGLVRRILTYENEPGLLILNNVCYNDGTNAQEVHNEVGAYYKLPMVSIKNSVYKEVEEGRLSAADITPDDLHPNDKGHRLVADVVINMLEEIYKKVMEEGTEKEFFLPEKPLTANRYMDSLRINNKNAEPVSNGFVKDTTVQENITEFFRNGFTAEKVNDTIHFEVEGRNIAAQYRKTIKRTAPVAVAIVDGNKENPVILDANFEEDWGDCLYLQNLLTGGEKKKHTVDITVTEADETSGLDFYLVSVIVSDR